MNLKPYDKPEWFEYLHQFDEPLRRATYAVFAHLGKPVTLNDFGCGACSTLNTAAEMGILATGYECSSYGAKYIKHPKARYIKQDLTKMVLGHHKAEMSFCWEVAEHLPKNSAEHLVDVVCHHTTKWLVWTSAHPGQGGQHHLNEQDFFDYWYPMFADRSFLYEFTFTDRLKDTWTWVTGPMHWLVENVRVMRRLE